MELDTWHQWLLLGRLVVVASGLAFMVVAALVTCHTRHGKARRAAQGGAFCAAASRRPLAPAAPRVPGAPTAPSGARDRAGIASDRCAA
jgi:hypothetical protein